MVIVSTYFSQEITGVQTFKICLSNIKTNYKKYIKNDLIFSEKCSQINWLHNCCISRILFEETFKVIRESFKINPSLSASWSRAVLWSICDSGCMLCGSGTLEEMGFWQVSVPDTDSTPRCAPPSPSLLSLSSPTIGKCQHTAAADKSL